MIKKAELHLHLEGSIPPSLVRKIAARNQVDLPESIFAENESFLWNGFIDFLTTFDKASSVLRTIQDYRDITYEYLASIARSGAIYAEMMVSPDHAELCGLSYEDHLAGVIQGIDDARQDYGIEGRIIITCVRHFGVEKCIAVAKKAAAYAHPYIVGFGMGGDEVRFPPKQFARAYEIAHEAGLGCTVHAGEMAGPESIWEAINYLPVTRIGHGVRAIEDENLLKTLKEKNIVLEVCPGSNIALQVYPNFHSHPFNRLLVSGLILTLSSDDPPYFGTTLAREYDIAQTHFSLTDTQLEQLTKNAIIYSFADQMTKNQLMARLEDESNQKTKA